MVFESIGNDGQQKIMDILDSRFAYAEIEVWILGHSLCSASHFRISILSSSHCHLKIYICPRYKTTTLNRTETDPAHEDVLLGQPEECDEYGNWPAEHWEPVTGRAGAGGFKTRPFTP